MSELNGDEGGLLAALPSDYSRGDEAYARHATAGLRQTLRRLTMERPLGRSTGVCLLGATYEGVFTEIPWPIRSVSSSIITRLQSEMQIPPPTVKRFNPQTMQHDEEPNLADIEYQRQVAAAYNVYLQKVIVHGYNDEIHDREGLCWHPEGTPQDMERALAVLRFHELPLNQQQQLREAIEALSQSAAQREERDRVKKLQQR